MDQRASMITLWGLVAAVGAAVDQVLNPTRRAEDHLQQKIALRAIESAVRYEDLDLGKASRLRNVARRDPEQALRLVAGHPEGPEPRPSPT